MLYAPFFQPGQVYSHDHGSLVLQPDHATLFHGLSEQSVELVLDESHGLVQGKLYCGKASGQIFFGSGR